MSLERGASLREATSGIIASIQKSLLGVPDNLDKARKILRPMEYDVVVEERHHQAQCGYPLCLNQTSMSSTQPKVTFRPVEATSMYCSDICEAYSLKFRRTLSEDPLYFRKSIPELKDLVSELDKTTKAPVYTKEELQEQLRMEEDFAIARHGVNQPRVTFNIDDVDPEDLLADPVYDNYTEDEVNSEEDSEPEALEVELPVEFDADLSTEVLLKQVSPFGGLLQFLSTVYSVSDGISMDQLICRQRTELMASRIRGQCNAVFRGCSVSEYYWGALQKSALDSLNLLVFRAQLPHLSNKQLSMLTLCLFKCASVQEAEFPNEIEYLRSIGFDSDHLDALLGIINRILHA